VKRIGVTAEIRSENIPYTSVEPYRHENLLGHCSQLKARSRKLTSLCHFCINVVSSGAIRVSEYAIDLVRRETRALCACVVMFTGEAYRQTGRHTLRQSTSFVLVSVCLRNLSLLTSANCVPIYYQN
jgi:hypothetical protein